MYVCSYFTLVLTNHLGITYFHHIPTEALVVCGVLIIIFSLPKVIKYLSDHDWFQQGVLHV